MISWGDPVLPNAPKFDVKAQTAAAQRGQFGFNNDFAGLLPVPGQKNRFLLVTNFEYVTPQFMFPGYDANKPTREQFDIEIAAIGMGVVEVERTPQGLKPVMGPYNRRITADTPFTLTGPGAGTDFVKTPADPTGREVLGTFANCSGGVTPWGTVLSGEENFHSYFGAPEGAPKPNPVDADRFDRYGVALEPSELLWENFDPRFDAAKTPNEVNRFGWIVELNPWDPNSKPVKHTRDGPAQARGRHHLCHHRRHRRGLQRGRRALRLHVQVRLRQEDPGGHGSCRDGAQHDDARRGHAVRREADQRHPRPDEIDGSGQAAVDRCLQGHREPGFRCCAPDPTVRANLSSTG